MNIRTVKFEDLTADEIAVWSTIQCQVPALSSPFFRPEFTQLVASVRADVEVAVLEEAGAPVGFFPFQRTLFGAGLPIGSGLCDYHALVAMPGTECDPLELLRACRLTSWRFDHLVPVHASFDRFAWSTADSPYIDLSDGLEGYLKARENGTSIMAEYRRKRRRIEREFGALRYEPHVCDSAVLAQCIQWKSEKQRRTCIPDIFKFAWTAKLLNRILEHRGQDFAPAMTVCYAGDWIAAINFGMRSREEFHSWFPTYNPDLGQCSPGLLHFIEMMKAAQSEGIRRIILGKGDESYKQRLMNGADRVAQGCVDGRTAMSAARWAWRQTRQSIKASPLRSPARVPARLLNRVAAWMIFR